MRTERTLPDTKSVTRQRSLFQRTDSEAADREAVLQQGLLVIVGIIIVLEIAPLVIAVHVSISCRRIVKRSRITRAS